MDAATFRALGHRLVDQLAEFLESVPRGPVTRDESPSAVREALDLTGPLPESGTDPAPLLEQTAQLLFDHSLFNGHPRFFGYITASPAPIGMLGDFLAAAVNPNVGAWTLSPAATEIESQTVRWIAELIGYPADCGGLLVSGGNMANFVCFLAARAAKAGWDVREHGVAGGCGTPASRVRLGRNAHLDSEGRRPGRPRHRVDPLDSDRRETAHGRRRLAPADRGGRAPRATCRVMVVGTAGSVSTGAVDPLPEIAAVCREHGVWFHVDGAYGGFAAARSRGARRSARARARPIRSRSIRTSGSTRRSRPAARWCAIRRRCARRSPTTRPTTTSTSTRRTTSTTARRTRAASAR